MRDAVRHVQRELPAVRALGPHVPVPSPCNNVCRIDIASGLCEGCLRTIDEVVAWGTSSEDRKREVWAALGERAARLERGQA